MFPAKGSLLILDHRINRQVINRCRKPADADILVPGDTISLIGTTSEHIPYAEIDDNRVTTAEVDTLLREGENWLRYLGVLACCAPIPACVHWWPAMMTPADAASAAVSFCSTTPTRRHGGLYHHYRRQADDLSPDGGVGHGCSVP
jgi:hypothetical protein